MRTTLALLLLLWPAAAQDLEQLARNVADYPTKFKLIRAGLPAIAPLMAQVTSENAKLAFESRSAIRWIVNQTTAKREVAHHLVRYCGGNHPAAVRIFTCELLGDLGVPTTIGMLSAMLSSDEPAALAAVAALKRIPDSAASGALVSNIKRSSDKVRDAIYRALGARRDKRVLPVLLDAAKSGNLAAAAALGDAGFKEAVPVLEQLAKGGSKTAYLSLLRLDALAVAHKLAKGEARILLWIEAAGRSRTMDLKILEILSKHTTDRKLGEPAHHAMLAILEGVDPATAAPLVRSILEEARERSVIVRSLAGCARCRDPRSVELIVPHVSSTDANIRTTAVVALRDIPGDKAGEALVAALSKLVDPFTQKMLIEALGARGEARGAQTLEEWMKPGEGMRELREAAIKAYVQIADNSDDVAARTMYLTALKAGATKAALEGLAEVGDASSLPAVQGVLSKAEGDMRAAALEAVIAIAERLERDGRRKQAIAAYVTALDAGAMVENRLRLLGEPVEITARGGRVSAWWVIGPYRAAKTSDWPKKEPPEDGVDLKQGWKPIQVGGKDAIVDLNALFRPNEQVTAYAYAEILVKKEREAVIKCGSDDGIRCWLNGKLVHSNLVLRGLKVDEDSFVVRLAKGRNTLLVKVCEMGGGWNLCLRLTDAKGRPLKFKIR